MCGWSCGIGDSLVDFGVVCGSDIVPEDTKKANADWSELNHIAELSSSLWSPGNATTYDIPLRMRQPGRTPESPRSSTSHGEEESLVTTAF